MDRPSTPQLLAQARLTERAQEDGRFPLPGFAAWDIFPFEGALSVKALQDAVLPEPPRQGVDGTECGTCRTPDSDYLWTDADWRVRATSKPSGLPVVLFLEPRAHHDLDDLPAHLVDGMGRMLWRVERALLSLGGIARVQVNRWGDGMAHLHWWFFPRPEGFVQGRGSFLPQWDSILPPRPEPEWRRTLAEVATALES